MPWSSSLVRAVAIVAVGALALNGCAHSGAVSAVPPRPDLVPSSGQNQQYGRSRRKHFDQLVAGVVPSPHDPADGLSVRPSSILGNAGAPSGADRDFGRLRSLGHTRFEKSNGRSAHNVSGFNSAGQFGIYLYPGRPLASGTFGYQTGYEFWEMSFLLLSANVLYAPTSRGAGGSCLEIGSVYNTLFARVYAYDFCDPLAADGVGVFHYLANIDGGFRNTYERDYGDGLPSYVYETYRNPSNNKWDVILFNASTGSWDFKYESQTTNLNPLADPTAGWNMFETHYFSGGACPPVLSMHSFNNQWYNPDRNAWEYLDTVPGMQYNFRTTEPKTDCLNTDDLSERGYYYLMLPLSLHEWYVDSIPSASYSYCDPTVSDCCAINGTCTGCDITRLADCCATADAYSCRCDVATNPYLCQCDTIYVGRHPIDLNCGESGLSRRRSPTARDRGAVRSSRADPAFAAPGTQARPAPFSR